MGLWINEMSDLWQRIYFIEDSIDLFKKQAGNSFLSVQDREVAEKRVRELERDLMNCEIPLIGSKDEEDELFEFMKQ